MRTPTGASALGTEYRRLALARLPPTTIAQQRAQSLHRYRTILGIPGASFAVAAGETRLTECYSIQTLCALEVFHLTALLQWRENGVPRGGRLERISTCSGLCVDLELISSLQKRQCSSLSK
ncbi:hypothetical protein EXIGLDRAFT_516316 [Exidia glandulosa HHB12029]|uniref:Uncharacterized protein n=1 Tax=Exidia glandulosa HHB12029 TaxID=1314781 RepID=A0A166N3A7_EXIGL|nr:hypothetical protein EXIGLDRAFT_516316 [Exidia glandulosa HHB12029]